MPPSNTDNPITIAAVIPAYNAGRFITRTLTSVFNQTRPADEVIVVDDGSTDDTAEIIRPFGDRIRYLRQANAGAAAARNTGIRAATAEWIAFLDGDDEWPPDKLALQEAAIRRRPDLAWHTGNYILCSCGENRQAPGHDPDRVDRLLAGADAFPSYFYAYQNGIFSCMDAFIVRKSVLLEVGLFKADQPRYNDLELWFRIAYRYPEIGFVNQPLGIYHLDISDSVTRKYADQAIFYRFLDHHIRLALDCGQLHNLAPCLRFMLTSRLRGLIFRGDTANIRHILRHYRRYLSPRFANLARAATVCPWLTACCCAALSRINRTFNIRKQIVRRDLAGSDRAATSCR